MNGNKRKAGKIIFSLFLVTGVMILLYPLFTFLYAAYTQHRLITALEQKQTGQSHELLENYPVNGSFPDNLEQSTDKKLAPNPDNPGNNQPARTSEKNDLWGIIEIPEVGLSAAVVSGTQPAQLRKGPGWYSGSALPGKNGNVVIAGHRSTYGVWFRHLDRLEKGDRIDLKYQNNCFTYDVENVFPVKKNDWSVVKPTSYPALTLIACHPVGSAGQRLVVRAKLESKTHKTLWNTR